ncbi:MAG: radical SAM protein [Deltaproteobacteria bacterium]|nr:radical SAM protein [Deltaproteobacteria bacterium]
MGTSKDPSGCTRVVLIYPNTYYLGMSNLGFQSVLRLFNNLNGCSSERAFFPEEIRLKEFVRTGTPLFSLETQTPLNQFDILAFSISFEDDFFNIPHILKLAGIDLYSKERKQRPLVIAGGVAVSLNPEPIAPFVDLFFMGEAESLVGEFFSMYQAGLGKKKGCPTQKEELLHGFASIKGIYVPSLYEFDFDGVGIKSIRPLEGVPSMVNARKAYGDKNCPMPESIITTPDTEFKDTVLMEIERGCGRGCRFCVAGFLYLPPRWGDDSVASETLTRAVSLTGRAGLVGAAVSEYPGLKPLLEQGLRLGADMTISSIRVDTVDEGLLGLLKKAGLKTVTFAPEAGTERLRSVINKHISNSEIIESARLVGDAGFTRLKLYFMLGLPTETDEDAVSIAGLVCAMRKVMKRGKFLISINPFVPKPFTPFQWHPFEHEAVLEKRFSLVKKEFLRIRGVELKRFSVKSALRETYLSRADRRAARVLAEALGTGKTKALKGCASPCMEEVVYRTIGFDEVLPWDTISHGLDKRYLWKEYMKGLKGLITSPCDVGRCFRCGVC